MKTPVNTQSTFVKIGDTVTVYLESKREGLAAITYVDRVRSNDKIAYCHVKFEDEWTGHTYGLWVINAKWKRVQ